MNKYKSLLIVYLQFIIPHALSATQDSAEVFQDMIILKIAKESHSAAIMPVSNEFPFHIFKIAIGKDKGDKLKEGDNRTPEGIYLPQRHIETLTINPDKFGPQAIALNFPNSIDKMENKTGSGIWLHGAGDDDRIAMRNATEGCVAFFNADILKISDWVFPQKSLVIIADRLDQINIPSEMALIKHLSEQWIHSWQTRNLEKYIAHYHPSFKHKNRGLKAYKEYKNKVFRKYKKMEVKIHDLVVATHPKYAIALMNQNFTGDTHFISNGRKILYWQKTDSDEWKIRVEYFDQSRFETLKYTFRDIEELKSTNKIDRPADSSLSSF